MTILLSSCAGNSEFKIGEQMSEITNNHTPYINMNALSAYESGSNYLILINDGGIVQKLVEFSPERKNISTEELDLIQCEDINQFLGMDTAKLKEKYGQPHVDVGSGFYIPSYITDDAYLICLELEDDIVFEVIKYDLLTNDIVDRVSS